MVRIFKSYDDENAKTIEHHDGAVLCHAVHDKMIVTGGEDNFVNIFTENAEVSLTAVLIHLQ